MIGRNFQQSNKTSGETCCFAGRLLVLPFPGRGPELFFGGRFCFLKACRGRVCPVYGGREGYFTDFFLKFALVCSAKSAFISAFSFLFVSSFCAFSC